MVLEDVLSFITLAECKNYTQAAEQLFISQSSLSKRIQKLEDIEGVKLFVRNTKTVELSRYGEIYYKYAKQIQTASAACNNEIKELCTAVESLRIGCIPSIAEYNIAPLLFDFMNNSNTQCHIVTARSTVLEKKLIEGSYDFAFIRDVDSSLNLCSIPFKTDQLMVVLPENHGLAKNDTIHIKDLMHEKFLLHPVGTRPYNNIILLCQKSGFEPNVVYNDPHMRNIVNFVSRGMGVSLLMNNLIPSEINGIVTIPIEPDITSKISLCYSSDHELSSLQRNFLKYYKSLTPTC